MRTRNHKADIPRQGHRTENNRLATRILFAGRLGKLALPYGSAPRANIGRRGFGSIDVVRHIDFRRLETASLLPALIEIPDFDYSNFYDIILQEWIYNVLNSGLVDKDKILNDAKRYELILKEIFDEYVKPDKNTLYELIEDKAYKLYADGYFD